MHYLIMLITAPFKYLI